eukprot:CCRYP_003765-RA/>CCRYP_003765-RA protein AED:0.32 eAED:0.32 QI:0/0/0/1/0/0/2/0/220
MEMVASAMDHLSFHVGCVKARAVARMCLSSGLHCVSSDSVDSTVYCGGDDGKVYCVDMDAYAIHERLDGGGTPVCVDRTGTIGVGADLEILLGKNVMLQQDWRKMAGDQSKVERHVKAVLFLAFLDPSNLASTLTSSETAHFLASESEDGTVRIWDLHTRSCVRVLRLWAPSSEGISLQNASVTTLPTVTGFIAVPKSSLMHSSGTHAMGLVVGLHFGRR